MSDRTKELPIQNPDRFYGVEIQDIVSVSDKNIKNSRLGVFVDKVQENPDILLNMPVLSDTGNPKLKGWLDLVGIEDVNATLPMDQVIKDFHICPEVLGELKVRDSIQVKDILEEIRYEFAVRVFANRKFKEATDFLKKYVSPNLIPAHPAKVVVLYDQVQDPYLPRLRFSGGQYLGNLNGTDLFSINLDEGTRDVYLNPFNTFETEVEHDTVWTLAHEEIHAWQESLSGKDDHSELTIQKAKKDRDFNSDYTIDAVNRIHFVSLDLNSGVTLSNALQEGFAVYIETKVADADINKETDPVMRKQLIEMRKNLYLSHREVNGVSPYFEGFYEIVRKVRAKVPNTERMIKLFSLMDYQACSKIELQDDDGYGSEDRDRYISNPDLIPLIGFNDNPYKTVGEFIQSQE